MYFKIFDKNDKGYVSLSDLQAILYSTFSMSPRDVDQLFRKIDTNYDNKITFGNS